LSGYLDEDWHDCTRPESSFHIFGPYLPKEQQRFAVTTATER